MTRHFRPRLPSTLSRKNYEGNIPGNFTASFLRPNPSSPPVASLLPSARRPDEWLMLRRNKLTTSAFSTSLGFWKANRRSGLWHHKVFAPRPDSLEEAAAAAMNWGTANEAAAIERYKIMTGNDVSILGFAAHVDAGSGWLGGSPGSVVPARQAVAAEGEAAAMSYEPEARHELTGRMIGMSIKLAEKVAMVWRDVGGRVEFFH
ncbi:hypothetical protein KSP40_PGU003552 [Platanthera guangdongensis]|uniref:YqaJ viral recombinase domain-containing protein n=1 Tax=Platanthera guangdongensis TaxID=2320717 RepID=A0ABR2LCD7_9ASPA